MASDKYQNISVRKEAPNGPICRMFLIEIGGELRPLITNLLPTPPEARPITLPDNAIYLVAETQQGDEVLGSLALIPLAPDSTLSKNLPKDVKAAEIKRMFVRQSVRKHGVGRRLLEAVEEMAKGEMGFGVIVLETLHVMDWARAFYERCGYRRRGVFGGYDARDSQCYEKYL